METALTFSASSWHSPRTWRVAAAAGSGKTPGVATAAPPHRLLHDDRAQRPADFTGSWARGGLAATCVVGSACRRARRLEGRRRLRRRAESEGGAKRNRFRAVLELNLLGRPPSEKALNVNLDNWFYGSFAEIGAGQEVSRTFLLAGAAAGTVAQSVSAYDMRMSDEVYGKAKRYVTLERLEQMMASEYDLLEKSLRQTRGERTRFFAFASTLAAKAYNSDRECEGWVGLTYQHAPGAERSTVTLHIRMDSNDTAVQQGEAVGVLGTNLIYLCHGSSDPYFISQFLLDGIKEGKIEVDYANFQGPAFPEGPNESVIVALALVQFRQGVGVILDYDSKQDRWKQVVPNNALYKRPIVVQRSRFRPVTLTHAAITKASAKQLAKECSGDPVKLMNLQIDDLIRPQDLVDAEPRAKRLSRLEEANRKRMKDEESGVCEASGTPDGNLTLEDLKSIATGGDWDVERVEEYFKIIDQQKKGSIPIDTLANLDKDSYMTAEFLDRFDMLKVLGNPVLVSGIRQDFELTQYLERYTKEPIAVCVGGGEYSIERGLFNNNKYEQVEGGLLAAFGRLFRRDGKVVLYQFPRVKRNGTVLRATDDEIMEEHGHLHNYLVQKGKIKAVEDEFIDDEVLDRKRNSAYWGDSAVVQEKILAGDDIWERLVPDEVAEIIKERALYQTGEDVALATYMLNSHIASPQR